MSSNKKYYKDIDFIRVLSCIAILLYHLNILKGGYLAVCTFFVLSGYLSCVSAFRKDKLSLKEYYLNRLIKIYVPLLIVVFITIGIISFLPSIKWLNLKPETTSVLLGYNNFWQLSANLDYFARHINSPFIHLWYIGILIQFDLVFPFIFIGLKKLGEKFKKQVPCIVVGSLVIIATLYFYKMSLTNNIMATYYSTFTRIFSLLFGVALGFIHSYYGLLIPKFKKRKKRKSKNKIIKIALNKNNIININLRNKKNITISINKKKIMTINRIKDINRIVFYAYILILICLFIFVDAKSVLFPYSMIFVTIISCRLIDYGIINTKENLSTFDKIINFFSKVSYEVYLIQYPVIFLLQNVNIDNYIKIPLIIIITIALSYILNFIIDFKNNKFKSLKNIMFSILLCFSLYGVYYFITAPDYSKEMKVLEKQLEQNQEVIKKRQEEYKLQLEQEQEDYEQLLNDLENGENNLEEIVSNLSIVGVGDSVMLGAVENLYNEFPNGYFDAQISRTAWVAHGILSSLKRNNMLGDIVVLNLGANGDCSFECKKEIIELCEDRSIFWLTVTNDKDVNVNSELFKLSDKYYNVHIIDWETISKGHNEYFFADGIHLTGAGRKVYTKAIYDSIYNVYLEDYKNKKEQLIIEHEEKQKNKISFYGNDILLNVYDSIQDDFKTAQFNINKQFDYESLKSEIEAAIANDSLTNKIVLSFDSLSGLSSSDYKKLIDLCLGKEIYVVATTQRIYNELSKIENINIVNFYQEIQNNPEYLMVDGIHLTENGNKALSRLLKESIEN